MNQDILLSHNSSKKSGQSFAKQFSRSFQQDDDGKYKYHRHNNNNSNTSYNSQEFSPKQTILPTTTFTNDKSSSYIVSNHRTLASELAANAEELSASLITTTRPPSSFDHQSLHSYTASYRVDPDIAAKNKISTSSSSAYGNDHNIWGINSTNNENNETDTNNHSDDYTDKDSGTTNQHHRKSTGSDDQSNAGADFLLDNQHDRRRRKQQPRFNSEYHNKRPVSPGQYFGARSLPLESIGDLWQHPSSSSSYPLEPQKRTHSSRSPSLTANNLSLKKKIMNDINDTTDQRSSSSRVSYANRSYTSSAIEPLWQNFKTLPTSLHHRHHWNRWEIHQQTSTPQSRQGENATSVTPPPARSTLSRISSSIQHDAEMERLTKRIQPLRIHDGNTNAVKSGYAQQPRPQHTSYSLHPHDSVTVKCIISSTAIHTHDGHLTLTNNDEDNNDMNAVNVDEENQGNPLVFSLFSANGNVTFDVQSGTVYPGQTIDIWIRPRKRVLHRLVTNTNTNTNTKINNTTNRHNFISLDETTRLFDESVALLIGQDLYRLKVNLDITVEDPEEEEEEDDMDDEDDDDQQLQQLGQDEQEISGAHDDGEPLDQTTTPPVQTTENHNDTDWTTAVSPMENQGQIDKAPTLPSLSQIQGQGHQEPCPFCLLETLYPPP
ncbi:hypothetical protein BCR42DRAFT_422094 [Absidia repens]|uniref:Uncharacterized protein n=1 Tax=Absidia repens TaxID=90262 RepID=A0A1X2I7F5_9FUNG|nr:hypothetical protein BCR42DRAFT_422094 [Absidia repens]